ncbi:MAG TPA: PD-(D/E)XK nuclease family protein [Pseudonocardia sp.]|nr:PD-(D/E)XK nuclease family protein [Pseudonocardia sp.]
MDGVAGAQLGLDELGAGFDLPPRLARVTPARLGAWTSCPRRYRLTYLDRPAHARRGARAHNTLGAVVHLALRALFSLPAAQRTAAAAAGLVDRNWSSEGFRDAAQAAEYRARARGWVAEYVERLDPDVEPVGVERWVSVPTGRVLVEGRADRIDERDGELVIVDYKTGRRAPGAADARRSAALALYALAAQHTMHRPCRRVELHHLPTGEVAAWEHDAASLRSHLEHAEAVAAESAAAADALAAGVPGPDEVDALFPARTSAGCASCEFRAHCPEGRAAVPEAEPWALLAP